MTAPFPWFKFHAHYLADWRIGGRGPAVIGAFVQTLAALWSSEDCALPADSDAFAMAVKIGEATAAEAARQLLSPHPGKPDLLTFPPLLAEWAEAEERRHQCRTAGQRSAAKRWGGGTGVITPAITPAITPVVTSAITPVVTSVVTSVQRRRVREEKKKNVARAPEPDMIDPEFDPEASEGSGGASAPVRFARDIRQRLKLKKDAGWIADQVDALAKAIEEHGELNVDHAVEYWLESGKHDHPKHFGYIRKFANFFEPTERCDRVAMALECMDAHLGRVAARKQAEKAASPAGQLQEWLFGNPMTLTNWARVRDYRPLHGAIIAAAKASSIAAVDDWLARQLAGGQEAPLVMELRNDPNALTAERILEEIRK
jgi:hypothetical protein